MSVPTSPPPRKFRSEVWLFTNFPKRAARRSFADRKVVLALDSTHRRAATLVCRDGQLSPGHRGLHPGRGRRSHGTVRYPRRRDPRELVGHDARQVRLPSRQCPSAGLGLLSRRGRSFLSASSVSSGKPAAKIPISRPMISATGRSAFSPPPNVLPIFS